MDRLACADLRAIRDSEERAAPTPQAVLDRLHRFSPDVEQADGTTNSFWLNAEGMGALYGEPHAWAGSLRASLREIGFDAAVVVGFSRIGTCLLARGARGIRVLASREEEVAAVGKLPLARLGLLPEKLRGLAQLGIRTAGELRDLPASDLGERFGPELAELWSLAAGDRWDPLRPIRIAEPITERLDIDLPTADAARLAFFAARLLGPLLSRADAAHRAVAAIEISLLLERGGGLVEEVKPAAPTLDERQLADLLRLRLESIRLPGDAVGIGLTARTVPGAAEQLHLFADRPPRDPAAAGRAFARLRAEFGDGAVARIGLREAHLPEARFGFVAMGVRAQHAAPLPIERRTLVRRIYARPVPLQSRPVCGPRGCHLEGMGGEPFSRITGPYIVSGGWWAREVEREYYFAETERGRILWVYFDRRRRRWFAHGEVS